MADIVDQPPPAQEENKESPFKKLAKMMKENKYVKQIETAANAYKTALRTQKGNLDANKVNFNKVKEKLKAYQFDLDDYDEIDAIFPEFAKDIVEYAKDTNNIENGNLKAISTLTYIWIVLTNLMYLFLKTLNEYIEYFSFYFEEINKIEYTNYEFFLNILFICLIMIIGFIMYWDYVYRESNKLSRCTKIRDVIDENAKNDYPFIYNIYVVHEENASEVLDKYIFRLEYNFFKKTTKVNYGAPEYYSDVVLELSDDMDLKKAFAYFDLNDMNYKFIERLNDDALVEKVDNTIITTTKYKYIVMTSTNQILTDQTSLDLAKFIRQYGKDRDTTHLYPVYNVLNAVEQQNVTSF